MTLQQFISALESVGLDITTPNARKSLIAKLSCHYKERATQEQLANNTEMYNYYMAKHITLRNILNGMSHKPITPSKEECKYLDNDEEVLTVLATERQT